MTCLNIINTGQLDPEIEKNKFQPFYSTKTRGYGLGLSISKKLAQQQNFVLTLENYDANQVIAQLCVPGENADE
jgi:nitrogen-specific signal transduction histidine kinase